MKTPAVPSAAALAAAITTYLRRLEADPRANVLTTPSREPSFVSPLASARAGGVRVRYRQGGTWPLTLAEAAHYLAGLADGFQGYHHAYFRQSPPPPAAPPAPGSAEAVAAGIDAHLKRLAADPDANPARSSGLGPTRYTFDDPSARAKGAAVLIRYVRLRPVVTLTLPEAAHYLAGLEGGAAVQHPEFFAEHPVPPATPSTVAEVAAAIGAHLARIEADPALNPEGEAGRLWDASARPTGRFVAVRYSRLHDPTALSLATARHYLAGLEAGFAGRHFEYLRAHPEPTAAPAAVKGESALQGLASAISAHLARLEADPEVNKPRQGSRTGLAPYKDAGAQRAGRFVRVRYGGVMRPAWNLTRDEAAHYLAGLEVGETRPHHDYFKRHPPPGSAPPPLPAPPPAAPPPPLFVPPPPPPADGGPMLNPADIELMPQAHWEVDVFWKSLQYMLDRELEQGLDLDPPWQRGHVWSEAQRVAYVEHVLRAGEAGKRLLFVCTSMEAGRPADYALLDGKQRLAATLAFLRGELRVLPDARRPEGYAVQDFVGGVDNLRRHVAFEWRILVAPSVSGMVDLYLRFNAGGTMHAPEELERVRALRAQLAAAEAAAPAAAPDAVDAEPGDDAETDEAPDAA